jgi:hypothetical protein
MTAPGDLFGRAAELMVGAILICAGTAPEQAEAAGLDFAFTVTRSDKPTPNDCEVRVWNLAPTTRTALTALDKIPVRLKAGYRMTGMSQIFFGNLRTVTHAREGNDIVTTIAGADSGALDSYQKSRVNTVIPKGTNIADAISLVALSAGFLQGNIKTALGNLALAGGPVLQRSLVLQGSTVRALTTLTQSVQARWSLQNGAVQILPKAAVVDPGQAVLLTPQTGLLDSPSIDNKGLLQARALLIPGIDIGRLLVVESEFVKGQFRISKVVYTGDTAGDDWTAEIEASRF